MARRSGWVAAGMVFAGLFAVSSQVGADTLAEASVAEAPLGGMVFGDRDGDGRRDAGEDGVAGLTVRLEDAGGSLLAITSTGPNGVYGFDEAAPGSYRVGLAAPTGYQLTTRSEVAVDVARATVAVDFGLIEIGAASSADPGDGSGTDGAPPSSPTSPTSVPAPPTSGDASDPDSPEPVPDSTTTTPTTDGGVPSPDDGGSGSGSGPGVTEPPSDTSTTAPPDEPPPTTTDPTPTTEVGGPDTDSGGLDPAPPGESPFPKPVAPARSVPLPPPLAALTEQPPFPEPVGSGNGVADPVGATQPPDEGPAEPETDVASAVVRRDLPVTGRETQETAWAGLVLITGGVAALGVATRLRRTTRRRVPAAG